MDLLQTYVKKHKMYVQSMRPAWPLVKRHDPFSLHFSDTALRQCGRLHPSVSGIAVPNLPSLLHFLPLVRGSAIGSTPAFGAGYPGSSPGPGAKPFAIAEIMNTPDLALGAIWYIVFLFS